MKLRLEAEPGELQDKSEDLLKALYDGLMGVAPEVADLFEKALPRKESELKYPVLRELQKRTTAEYERLLKRMVREIGKVIDRGPVAKSEQPTELVFVNDPTDLSKGWYCATCGAVSPGDRCAHVQRVADNLHKALYIGPRGGKWADPQHTVPWKDPTEGPTQTPEAKQLAELSKEEFQKIISEKGLSISMFRGTRKATEDPGPQWYASSPGTAARYAKKEGSVKAKLVKMQNPYIAKDSTEIINATMGTIQKLKAQGYDGMVIQWGGGLPTKSNPTPEKEIWAVVFDVVAKAEDVQAESLENDHTQRLADKDEKAYEQVKQALQKKGYIESDFEEGGPLYGWSTNELIDLARDKRMG